MTYDRNLDASSNIILGDSRPRPIRFKQAPCQTEGCAGTHNEFEGEQFCMACRYRNRTNE